MSESGPEVQLLPEHDERRWLLDGLRDQIQSCGSTPLRDAPILLPTDAFFPDPWRPDVVGVYVLARRLLTYAGLGHLEADVEMFTTDPPDVPDPPDRPAGTTHHQAAAAWFAGIDENTGSFGANAQLVATSESIVGAMAHEVAHAFRTHRGLVVDDPDEEECLTDLTTVYLGFGVLTTNASYLYRSSGDDRMTQWSHERLGYLGSPAMAYALAATLVARGLDDDGWNRVAQHLEMNQAAMLKAARKALADATESALVVEDGPSDRDPFDPGPLEKIAALPDRIVDSHRAQREEDARGINEGRDIFRVEEVKRAGWGLSLVVGMVIGTFLAIRFQLLGFLGGVVGVVVLGRYALVSRPMYCSDPNCAEPLETTQSTCPACGGRIRGVINHPNERLEAAERLRLGP